MRTEFFLALRYLRPRRNAVSVITLISMIGVMLGVAVLIVVLAVMTGFTDIMKEKLIQTQAHLHVTGGRYLVPDVPRAEKAILDAGGVRTAPVIAMPALLQHEGRFEPKLVFGADAAKIRQAMNIDSVLRPGGSFDLAPGEAVLGSRLAQREGIMVGDRIVLHSSAQLAEMIRVHPGGGLQAASDGRKIVLPTELKVTGIVSFGKYDFDRDIIFVNIDDAAELFGLPWGSATAVYGWVPDPFAMDGILAKLEKNLPPRYNIESWQSINAQLLGVLAVEKNMMFFLLIFIVLVAAFSIANTLITSVYQKTREIGLIKALGGGRFQVMNIFMLQGLVVGVGGSIAGTVFGCLVIYGRHAIMRAVSKITGQPLFPPEMYYFNELPAHIVPGDVLIVVISAILLCTAGGVLPALRAAKLDPARALRYE